MPAVVARNFISVIYLYLKTYFGIVTCTENSTDGDGKASSAILAIINKTEDTDIHKNTIRVRH